jgi:hypothetical protein
VETLQTEAEKLKTEIAEMEAKLTVKHRELHKCEEAKKILEGN